MFRHAADASAAGLRAAGASVVEVLAQRRSAVFLLRQAAPLQLGHDQIDELADVVHGMKSAAQDEAAVGAGLVMQLLEHIDDCFRRAGRDQDSLVMKSCPNSVTVMFGSVVFSISSKLPRLPFCDLTWSAKSTNRMPGFAVEKSTPNCCDISMRPASGGIESRKCCSFARDSDS